MTVSEPPQTSSPSSERAPLLPALQVDFDDQPETPPEPKIEVEKVHFYYGKTHALKGIDLTIYANRVTAFIGPSGCGKSTLLRTFNRMYELYPKQRAEGRIILDGTVDLLDPRLDLNLLRKRVGMVFQAPTPFPMSIYENIAFGVRLYERLRPADMNERVEWALHKAALWNEVKDKLKQSGRGLSGGQQQRLCIARAIAVKPEVLLLDEPTSALDPIAANQFDELLRDLRKSLGLTVFMVTHDLNTLKATADRIAMLIDKKLKIGTIEKLAKDPDPWIHDYFSGARGIAALGA